MLANKWDFIEICYSSIVITLWKVLYSQDYLKKYYNFRKIKTMKQKLTVSIDEDKVEEIDEVLKKGRFRNKSHVLEYSLIRFLEEERENDR
jgi:ribosomal protein S8